MVAGYTLKVIRTAFKIYRDELNQYAPCGYGEAIIEDCTPRQYEEAIIDSVTSHSVEGSGALVVYKHNESVPRIIYAAGLWHAVSYAERGES